MPTVTGRLPETPGNPHRLGRHFRHDSRSLAYAIAGLPTSTLTSTRWTRRVPVFDQGSTGSCTGQAAAGWLATDDAIRPGDPQVTEQTASSLYSMATELDDYPGTYPPDDTGSDGLSVAKALQASGYSPGYQHAFSLQAALTALQSGPVLFGTDWYESMFDPGSDGRLRIGGAFAGGHEYLVDEIDATNRRVWLTNSWGEGWGRAGRAWLTWDDAATLLARQGDVTVPMPLAPAPVPPQPPTPSDPDVAFAAAVDVFVDAADVWRRARTG